MSGVSRAARAISSRTSAGSSYGHSIASSLIQPAASATG
ncbi:Uncharacterised protein [Bordetella pertussis]|nr:Uncharacterised protein [Bordetella pertussis]CFW31014.1 Uncharacterised protein [Bordetella pertussis]